MTQTAPRRTTMIEHGYGPYSRGKCRCDEICRPAKRAYIAARRQAGLEGWNSGHKHETWTAKAPRRCQIWLRGAASSRCCDRMTRLRMVGHGPICAEHVRMVRAGRTAGMAAYPTPAGLARVQEREKR